MSVLGSLRAAREWAYPTLRASAFLEKGVLTPEEFVRAGDELVYKCPTWAWESGEPSKRKAYLPAEKQYLVTRNVPCRNRVSSMETALKLESVAGFGGGGGGGDEDWLVSTIVQAAENPEDDFDILDSDGEVIEAGAPGSTTATATSETAGGTAGGGDDDDDDNEYADMMGFEDDNVLEDDAAAATASAAPAAGSSNENNDHLVRVRTYDLSITYDKYYQTPRVWMIGKNASDQPLTAAEMMQDVISDYANKTVTMEHHPHASGHHASIHPCQHGKVMKAIVRNLIKASDAKAADGKDESALAGGPSVEMYLFIFLKFVSSMIPTINYDFTMDVTADTSK